MGIHSRFYLYKKSYFIFDYDESYMTKKEDNFLKKEVDRKKLTSFIF
jgi:hypothetical protein